MTKYKANLEDALDRESLTADISELATVFGEWETQDGQGTRQLWSVLGKVYELGTRIDQNGSVKRDLIEQVGSDPNVANSPKWNPSSKGAHELLLVKLLSLKEETKAKKCQWLSAIRAAKKEQTRPTRSDFVTFLERVGGIDGARRRHAKPSTAKPSFEELAQWAQGEVKPEEPPIQTPRFHDETPELPGKIGLVLVSGEKAGLEAIPITTITDRTVIGRAIEWMIKAEKAMQFTMESELEKEHHKRAMAIRKDVRKQYADHKRSKKWNDDRLEFSEFVERAIDADDNLLEQSAQIPDLAKRIEFGNAYKLLPKTNPNYKETEGHDQFEIQRRTGFRTRS